MMAFRMMMGSALAPTSSITAKSVIFDIADNWTNATVGARQIDFKLDNVSLDLESSDFTAYATSNLNTSYTPDNLFNSLLSKIGTPLNTSWLAGSVNTNQRVIIVFNVLQEFDEITINNYHNSGTDTNAGFKNLVINTSNNSITNTTYAATIEDGIEIFDGQTPAHISSNEIDEQLLWEIT